MKRGTKKYARNYMDFGLGGGGVVGGDHNDDKYYKSSNYINTRLGEAAKQSPNSVTVVWTRCLSL